MKKNKNKIIVLAVASLAFGYIFLLCPSKSTRAQGEPDLWSMANGNPYYDSTTGKMTTAEEKAKELNQMYPGSTPSATGGAAPTQQAPINIGNNTTGGIVPCNLCTLCHLIIGFQNIVKWLMGLLFTATILFITVSGVLYMVSSGNKALMDWAKNALTYSLMGFALFLGAWLIVASVLTALGYKQAGSWSTFSCDTSLNMGTGGAANTGNTGGAANNPNAPNQSNNNQPLTGKGCDGVVQNIRTMEGWQYSQADRMADGFADCSSSAYRAYQAAGCSLPQQNSNGYASMGQAIGDSSSLRAGDVIAYPGHVVTCLDSGCNRVMNANSKNGIHESNGSYYTNRSDARVLHASDYCPGC